MLYAPDRTNISLPFKLEFFCTKNKAKYKDLVIEFISALKMENQRLRVKEDSKLIIKQVNSEFTLKEISLVSYRTAVQKLLRSFKSILFEHAQQTCRRPGHYGNKD